MYIYILYQFKYLYMFGFRNTCLVFHTSDITKYKNLLVFIAIIVLYVSIYVPLTHKLYFIFKLSHLTLLLEFIYIYIYILL